MCVFLLPSLQVWTVNECSLASATRAPLLRKQNHLTFELTRYELEYRIRRPDGQVRWVMDRGLVMRDEPTGQATRVVGVLIDISQLKAAEQRQRLLFDELNHRVKNTLAIVQSLAQQTLRTRPDPAVSVPSAKATSPAAVATALPEDEPPLT